MQNPRLLPWLQYQEGPLFHSQQCPTNTQILGNCRWMTWKDLGERSAYKRRVKRHWKTSKLTKNTHTQKCSATGVHQEKGASLASLSPAAFCCFWQMIQVQLKRTVILSTLLIFTISVCMLAMSWFLTYMRSKWMYVISCVCLASRLAVWPSSCSLVVCPAEQKLWCWTLFGNCSAKFFHTCHTCRLH